MARCKIILAITQAMPAAMPADTIPETAAISTWEAIIK